MAKFAPILGNLAGSIGANTWANNKGGMYVRRRSKPTNPNSSRQQAVRAILSTLSKAWASLTAPQKSDWRNWADGHPQMDSLGNTVQLTGSQAYNMLNSRLVDAGLAAVADAPVDDAPASLLTLSVARASATTATVTYTTTPTGAGIRLQIWMTTPTAGDTNPNFKQAVLVGYTAANVASPQTVTLPKSWSVGQTCTFFVKQMNASGLVSPELRSKVTA